MKDKNAEFQKYYNLLISMSYRMMGSFVEAEDIVQEVAIEWMKTDVESISNEKAWLLRVCTNKAIDCLKKAYKKREVYTGTWLPEILPNSFIVWDNETENKESLNTSFLILLENLNPKERAVYILRSVFEYDFKKISEFTDLKDSNCRKIFERANDKIHDGNKTYDKNDENSLNILEKLFEAAKLGSEERIKELLSRNSEFWSDGGGKVSASRRILDTMQKIGRFLANIFKSLENDEFTYQYEYMLVNYMPGVVLSKQDENGLWKIETIFSFELLDNKIERIYAQRNPDKLRIISNTLRGK
jgi:RNA polymerase sigma-70 factor (ECF subfamily)